MTPEQCLEIAEKTLLSLEDEKQARWITTEQAAAMCVKVETWIHLATAKKMIEMRTP